MYFHFRTVTPPRLLRRGMVRDSLRSGLFCGATLMARTARPWRHSDYWFCQRLLDVASRARLRPAFLTEVAQARSRGAEGQRELLH